MKTLNKVMQSAITPSMAIEILKEGNKRFMNNLKANRNLLEQANETSDGQHPFAVILSYLSTCFLYFQCNQRNPFVIETDPHFLRSFVWCICTVWVESLANHPILHKCLTNEFYENLNSFVHSPKMLK